MNMQSMDFGQAVCPRAAATVRQVNSAEEGAQALAVVTYGFVRDPIARWVWPTASSYACSMPLFVGAFSGRALKHGTADMTTCGGAAAFWLSPGVTPDEDAVMTVIAESVAPARATEMEEFFFQMASFHPKNPCWYLPQIAADPAFQGRGLGSALLEHRLRLIDASGEDAYLESSSPRNIALYERHGFKVIGEIQTRNSPKMFPMLRRAK